MLEPIKITEMDSSIYQYWPYDEPIDAVVLGNGDYPTHPIPLHILNNSPFTVCCDGAADKLIAHNLKPNLIVGDCDSVSACTKEKYSDILLKISEQETNDQTKAVKTLINNKKRNIAIVGATGSREDHTIGNIALLSEYQKMSACVAMFTNHGTIIPCHGNNSFASHHNQQISIFNINCKSMESQGLTYPLYTLTNWWQGTLNNSEGNSFSISADGDYIVMMGY